MLKMSRNVLVCLLAVVVTVSPNPLLQRALNLCPIHGNPQNQLNIPFELPLQLTQQSPPPCNPYSTPVVNNPENEAHQILVNKVLSNPLVKALVDQNSKQILPAGPHHVVNNYFIIPSEVLLNETRKAEDRVTKECRPLPGPSNCRAQFGERVQQKVQNSYCRQPNRQSERRFSKPRDYESSDPRPPCRPRSRMYDDDRSSKNDGIRDGCRRTYSNLPPRTQDIYDICESDDEEVCRPQIKRSEDNRIREEGRPQRRPKGNCKDVEESTNDGREEMRPRQRQLPNPAQTAKDQNLSSKRKEVPDLNTEMMNENVQEDTINGKPAGPRNPQNRPSQNSNNDASKGRTTRNPSDEAIISDAKRKFPGMSEYLIRELLSNVKRQLTNQQHHYMGNRPYNHNPMYNNNYHNNRPPPYWHPNNNNNMHYPNNNNNIQYPNNMMQGFNGTNPFQYGPGQQGQPTGDPNKIKKNTKPKSNENNTANVENNQAKIATVKDTEKKIETVSNDGKDTHLAEALTAQESNKPNTGKAITKSLKENEVETSKSKAFDNTTPYVRKANTDPRLFKLGEEDELPHIGENGIHFDDYYPDFTVDNKAYSFDNEFYEYYDEDYHRTERTIHPNHQRNSFDKYGEKDGQGKLRRRNFKENNIPKHNGFHTPAVDENEEIIYKTPPGLETPDFQTFKIKNENSDSDIKPRFYDADDYPIFKEEPETTTEKIIAKTSTYSHAKSPIHYFSSTPPANVLKETTLKSDSIETVFANSKIVKYHTQDLSDEDETSTQRSHEKDIDDVRNKYAVDSDTTIVLAESLGYPEKW